MKISYVSSYDANDIHNWSGLGYNISKALEAQGNHIEYIGKLKTSASLLQRLKRKFYKRQNLLFDVTREISTAKSHAEQASLKISNNSDIIFSPGSIPFAYLKSNKPKVIYTDATFAGLLNFYDEYSFFCQETIRHGNFLEQRALSNADLILYSSDWAAQTAIDNYKVNPEKIKVVPFGANVVCNRSLNQIKEIVTKKSNNDLDLLFIGVEWKRKGGDLALKITESLNSLGINTTLHIVGIRDLPTENMPSYVINHGFISKSTSEGVNKLERLFMKCHFLIVPSLAEAYGLVFCEANSYGLPSISTNVGGIPTVIKNEFNGRTFSLETPIEIWSHYIYELFIDKNRYLEMCLSSFNEYETRLNWNVAGKSIMNLLREL
jgi:glycosyltransferase involved in cell wall biosynthesis